MNTNINMGILGHKQYSDNNANYFGWEKVVDISGDGNTISIGGAVER